MSVKDLITIGIFSAIYFVINLVVMVCGGITPLIWICMPPILSILCGVVYMLLVAKVQKTGAVLIMGLITGVIYVATGQFTLVLLLTFGAACIIAEIIRKITGYNNFKGNLLGYAFFLWAWLVRRCQSGFSERIFQIRWCRRACLRIM